ncbi:MAG: DNA alkylation repair protein [Bacteroidetes bacterium]|jgi:3-methyladenine DNA glycosylase AlkD|nr:DNA alkylation repair protein [Bacteroidota bacterium]MBP6649063.1 DNA alkylation repair protein [Bacteroidia bacterium]
MDIIKLLIQIKNTYKKQANPEIAEGMSAYMKDKFDFFGIKKPLRNDLLKAYLPQLKNIPASDQIKAAKWLWGQSERELHYLAFEILYRNRKLWTEEFIELFEELIVNKSWWDTVDYIASTLVGYYFEKWPKHKNKKAKQWARDKNLWLNRTAIIFQLKYKENTDLDLLFETILLHVHSKEFFLQKAIGWALRQYAYTDMLQVKKFVATQDLKPLSIREALKHG